MKMNLATKLFLGFLVIICLNAFFVLIVSRLSLLTTITSIVKKQNEVKNILLQVSNLHATQERSRLIYGTIGKEESAENFKKTGSQTTQKMEFVLKNLRTIIRLDSIVANTGQVNPRLVRLYSIVNKEIVENNDQYNQGFSEFVALKKTRASSQNKFFNTIIDSADTKLKAGLGVTDSLIDDYTMTSIKEIETRVDNVKNLTQLILLGMSVFSISFALLFSRYISHHLRRLRESASTIAKGDFDFNPMGYPKDEIGDLANAFFDMAIDLKTTQDELIRKRRLAAIGEIVASVNHEINNPLMIISGNAQFLEMTLDDGVTQDTKNRIHAILDETERISQVTRKLRDIKNPVVEDYTSSGEQMINLDKSAD